MGILDEIRKDNRIERFGLHNLTSEERKALLLWLVDYDEQRARFVELVAIAPDLSRVEFDDGTSVAVPEQERAQLTRATLGDVFMLCHGRMHGYVESVQPALRAIMRDLRGEQNGPDPYAEENQAAIRDELRGEIYGAVQHMNREAIARRSYVIQFRFVGPGSANFYWRIDPGVPSAHEGCAEQASMTIEVRGTDFLDLLRGDDLTLQELYEAGRWRLFGDKSLMVEWADLFASPEPDPSDLRNLRMTY